DPDLPPVSYMDGVDLITEGILTLSKVSEMLKQYTQNSSLGKGPADEIIRMLLDSDEIHFLAGTGINTAHQDPTLPVELELRRTVVHRIARTLEEKFLKEVTMKFY
ncbi:MAG TPA: stage II sporulation protein E, partial [Bacteroidales bacterium]|nr:stage II sporulation protein E [Bacteroidales bacterium]